MGWSIHHPVGLIHHSPMFSYKGYTLVFTNSGKFASLIDMRGRVCHRWDYHEGITYAQLLPNGNLLIRTPPPPDFEDTRGLGGAGGAIVELDWNGIKLWEHRDPWMHHDYDRLLTGETIYLRWEPMPADISARVRGGRRMADDPIHILGDAVREVSADGETLREWHLWEQLDITLDVICPLEGRREWTHANSLAVTASGDLLVSFRQTSAVAKFSRETGKLLWRWGLDELSHQHDASELDNGNVLIFDNGAHSTGRGNSRIIEVNPESNEIAWSWEGSPPVSFYSSYISGAERLPNGNTLICEGAHGRLLEITRGGEIVWEFVNPFFELNGGGHHSNATFKVHRYAPDFSGFTGRDLDPARYANLNRLYATDRASI